MFDFDRIKVKLSIYLQAQPLLYTPQTLDTECEICFAYTNCVVGVDGVCYTICENCKVTAATTLQEKQAKMNDDLIKKIVLCMQTYLVPDVWAYLYSLWRDQLDVAQMYFCDQV